MTTLIPLILRPSSIRYWVLFTCASITALAASNYATPYSFTTLAGVSSIGSHDGTGTAAQFYGPAGIATDAAGNIFVADEGNHTIRKVTPAGVVTTFVGSPGIVGSADGTGASARLNNPQGLATDSSGNLFVADTGNSTIRKITPAGVVTTFAGLAGTSGIADGTGNVARFNRPRGIAVDTTGNVYVTEAGNRGIRKITSGRVVTSLAGGFFFPESADISASIPVAYGAISVDSTGSLFVSRFSFKEDYTSAPQVRDYYTDYIGFVTKITPDGTTSDLWETSVQVFADGRVAGTFVAGIAFDSAGLLVTNDNSFTFDHTGNKFLADAGKNILRRISPTGVETTLAGLAVSAARGTVDGTAGSARFTQPQGTALDAAGILYVTDPADHCIRKINPAGVVTTLAGSPGNPGSADGTGSVARFNQPIGITVDSAGYLYVADFSNHTIRKISPAGETTTLAGTAGLVGPDDGQGPAARFWYPKGIAVDTTGNVYVADSINNAIRKITAAGNVTTLAAKCSGPSGISIDGSGNLFVTETFSNSSRISKIIPSGEIATVAGDTNGSADGIGTAALFHSPSSIAADAAGNLFIADTYNHTVRKIAPDKTVTTIAGLVDSPGSSDGAGSGARFYYPFGVTLDASGGLYVTSGTTVRKGLLATAPMITDQPRSQTTAAGPNVTFTVSASGIPAPTYQWYVNGNAINGATDTMLSLANVRSTDAGDYTVVVTNALGSVTSNKATLTVSSAPAPTPTPDASSGGGGSVEAWFVFALIFLGLMRGRTFWRTE